ncbi:hypothetical protein ANO11243_063270 [Dothideomycetidae sp. 11243]|nr:hypothetical protein ANO11243_063270 [fungal sp. No.11243]
MAHDTDMPVRFGPHTVTSHSQVFHTTPLSYAIVNLRPLLPGHTLICPHRVVPHLSDLTEHEATDLIRTARRVQRTLKRVYKADAFNVAVQDGKAAGQSVPHVHWHVIPRLEGDMDSRGGGDRLYDMLDGEEGDVGAALRARAAARMKIDADRKDRSEEEMRAEAEMLRREMEKDQNGETEVD